MPIQLKLMLTFSLVALAITPFGIATIGVEPIQTILKVAAVSSLAAAMASLLSLIWTAGIGR
jgi:hypothetical protein